jgi:RNA recognition motif-containing protein
MPKDRVTQQHQGYGFVEFMGEEDADYAIKIMNMIKVHGKPIRVNKVGYSFNYYSYLHKNPFFYFQIKFPFVF